VQFAYPPVSADPLNPTTFQNSLAFSSSSQIELLPLNDELVGLEPESKMRFDQQQSLPDQSFISEQSDPSESHASQASSSLRPRPTKSKYHHHRDENDFKVFTNSSEKHKGVFTNCINEHCETYPVQHGIWWKVMDDKRDVMKDGKEFEILDNPTEAQAKKIKYPVEKWLKNVDTKY
jgi:hypothetical protein